MSEEIFSRWVCGMVYRLGFILRGCECQPERVGHVAVTCYGWMILDRGDQLLYSWRGFVSWLVRLYWNFLKRRMVFKCWVYCDLRL